MAAPADAGNRCCRGLSRAAEDKRGSAYVASKGVGAQPVQMIAQRVGVPRFGPAIRKGASGPAPL